MPPSEEEERRKIIIDGGAEVVGLTTCLVGSVALRSSHPEDGDYAAWEQARSEYLRATQQLITDMRP